MESLREEAPQISWSWRSSSERDYRAQWQGVWDLATGSQRFKPWPWLLSALWESCLKSLNSVFASVKRTWLDRSDDETKSHMLQNLAWDLETRQLWKIKAEVHFSTFIALASSFVQKGNNISRTWTLRIEGQCMHISLEDINAFQSAQYLFLKT